MFRLGFLLSTLVCFGNVGLTPAALTQSSVNRLRPIIQRLLNADQDVLDMSSARTGDCSSLEAFSSVERATASALASLQASETLLRVYSSVSSPADRARVGAQVLSELEDRRQHLELN